MSNEPENPRSEQIAPGIQKVYYSLSDLRKSLPEGVKVREESIGADGVLVHIQYPPDAIDSIQMDERLKNFMLEIARSVNRKVSIIASRNDLDIQVKRPRSVSLQINEVTVPRQAVLDEIRSIVEDSSVTTATVSITNTHIVEDQPQPQLTLETVEELIRRVVTEELDKRKPKRKAVKKTSVKSESPPRRTEAIRDKETMAAKPRRTKGTVARTPAKKKSKATGKSNGKHETTDAGTATASPLKPRKERSKRQVESTLDL